MSTLTTRSLVGLGLAAALLGGTVSTSSVVTAAPVRATQTVHATLLCDHAARSSQYTLHVTGTNFVPGASVKLALIDTATLKVVNRGSTVAQPAFVLQPMFIMRWTHLAHPPALVRFPHGILLKADFITAIRA